MIPNPRETFAFDGNFTIKEWSFVVVLHISYICVGY